MLSAGRPRARVSVPRSQLAHGGGGLQLVLNLNTPVCGSQALVHPLAFVLQASPEGPGCKTVGHLAGPPAGADEASAVGQNATGLEPGGGTGEPKPPFTYMENRGHSGDVTVPGTRQVEAASLGLQANLMLGRSTHFHLVFL